MAHLSHKKERHQMAHFTQKTIQKRSKKGNKDPDFGFYLLLRLMGVEVARLRGRRMLA
jgi:hypothetical protein